MVKEGKVWTQYHVYIDLETIEKFERLVALNGISAGEMFTSLIDGTPMPQKNKGESYQIIKNLLKGKTSISVDEMLKILTCFYYECGCKGCIKLANRCITRAESSGDITIKDGVLYI